jgi:GT2 family glycosyltransferase
VTRRPRPVAPRIAPLETEAARPFWSVMIPTHDSAPLLERTLASVLAQDPGPDTMQIEVVDDASTRDDPREVVERLGLGRVAFHRHERNVGPPANFTACVRHARGRWVHVLHSDDAVLPGFYDSYRRRIEACPRSVMVGGGTVTIDVDDRHLGVTPPVGDAEGWLRDAAFVIAATNPLRAVSAVVAREAYERVGGFNPDLFHAADWEMWARVAAAGPVAWVDEPFGLYRWHAGSDSWRLHQSTRYITDCLRAVRLISGNFDDPTQRSRARRAGRRVVAEYALGEAAVHAREGRSRLALATMLHAARADPRTVLRARRRVRAA